ncbi:MAG: RraA family protein [Chloroflexi bacterium]|nr:RraA family protein [Chloroflexota bacterium]
MPIGFRVITEIERPDRSLVEQFVGIPPSNIGDVMYRSRCMNPAIRYLGALGGTMVGTAITVRTAPGDNLMVHAALDLAEPGDVLVVDAGGDLSHAIVGELMARMAQLKGLAGFVIDGAMRDVAGIRELGFPVYARGATPAGPYKSGPGEVNVEIACGGVVVRPGDVLVGDEDGIVVVARDEAASVVLAARAFHTAEIAKQEEMLGGLRSMGFASGLEARGCEFLPSARVGQHVQAP